MKRGDIVVDTILIHHSASSDDHVLRDWDTIRKWHLEKGWRDIGYNYGIERVGDQLVWQTGRNLWIPAAHCPDNNMNHRAIGIVCVGNFELTPPAPDMIQMLANGCSQLCKDYAISPLRIFAHRDMKNTLCPGKYFPMQYLRDLTTAIMATIK